MSIHAFQKLQYIPGSLEKVWTFFSNPANLPVITPPYMKFKVLDPPGPVPYADRIYAGQLIDYTLRPLPGIKMYWLTEITHVKEGVYFVDEQRKGPYKLWHHQHHFREVDGGIEMTDIVHYAAPFGWIGDLANAIFVRRQLEGIFDYRFKIIRERF